LRIEFAVRRGGKKIRRDTMLTVKMKGLGSLRCFRRTQSATANGATVTAV
jgi:hypothetical protein